MKADLTPIIYEKNSNDYFSSFGRTNCYSLTYLEENFDKYYGEGYEVNPGYFYIAQTKSIVRLNKYFDGKTNAFAIFHAYNITEVYSK